MKSALSISAALLAAGVLSVAGTYAYFTHRDTERNAFTIGDNTSNVHEEFEPPEELTPGVNTYQKAVKVQNSGETDSFVCPGFVSYDQIGSQWIKSSFKALNRSVEGL